MAKSKYDVPSQKDLLDAGVHFGHQVRRWHPGMEQYIYTVKKDIHIIDLEQTEELLKVACEYLHDVAAKGGQIIFVGTKKQARDMVKLEALRSGALYVNERWLGGTITNFDVIRKKMKKLAELLRQKEAGELKMYTKKERLLIDREIDKLNRYVGGIASLSDVPAALFIVDAKREKTAIAEAEAAKVDVVALIDTNTNPEGIKHVIPGNDDGIKSVALILKAVGDAVESGYKVYAEKLEKGAIEKEAASKDSADASAEKAEKTEKVQAKVSGTESSVVTNSKDSKRTNKEDVEVKEEKVAKASKDNKAKSTKKKEK